MSTYVFRARKRRPLVHALCALALVFFVSVQPLVAFAETGTTPPLEQTTPSSSTSAPTTESQPSPQEAAPAPIATPPSSSAPAAEPTTESTQPAETTPGPQSPTGADSPTYTYDETTGLWSNGIYTWNPVTKQTQPVTAPTYSYNPSTGMWDTTEWRYDAPSGTYVENPISVPAPPVNALTAPSDGSQQQAVLLPQATTSALLPGLAPNNQVNQSGGSQGMFDLFYNAGISNSLFSSAVSGDATVSGNTTGGDAMTGDATAIANLLNLLQSSWNYLSGGGLTTFVANLFGDLFGDIMIDPISTPQALSQSTPSDTVTVNATGSGAINNDITLNAQSGDADVTKNTSGGDATTGDAYALANIINALGSTISAGNSFLGVINIFGNLDGDILLPTALKNLLAQPSSSAASSGDTKASLSSSQSITNTINGTATTGDADVSQNTTAGNATSGDASNTLTILNLTGKQIVGNNALLVFVNVFGNWLGLIVDAPGTQAAALGDSTSSSAALPAGTYDIDETQTIDNDITLRATSGDATVTKNTSAGNATSGDAVTSANIVNIINSAFAIKDWFGILFINIFGDWHGSFGVDTAAGEKTAPVSATSDDSTSGGSLVSYSTSTFSRSLSTFQGFGGSNNDETNLNAQILSSHITSTDGDTAPLAITQSSNTTPPQVNLFTLIGTIAGLSILAAERAYSHRDKFKIRFWSKA